ncbi:MAG: amidohydrolase family protein [Dehalococcoidia bacterium]
MIVDLEHHYSPPVQARGGVSIPAENERFWEVDSEMRLQMRLRSSDSRCNIDRHLWFMDEAGIDVAVMTGHGYQRSLEEQRRWHDACAQAVRDHPKRFVGFAGLKPLGGESAIKELERAVKELGMKGVQISARLEGRTLDSRELWPFYEKVSELGIPIDVHIATEAPGFDALHAPWGLYYVMMREYDISATVFRLCFGGVLEAFPNLVFIVNHFGGGVSAVKERMDYYVETCGSSLWSNPDKPLISKPWNEYFDKLYFSMGGRGPGMATVKCALTNISPRKMMFATDWPSNYENDPQEAKRYIEEIRKLDLPKDDIEAMLGGNAAKLLGLPAA